MVMWYELGKLHREDGPAVECSKGYDKKTTIKLKDFPHECPSCHSPAYIGGMNNVECSNPKCRLYVCD